jgi:hypothetical protein
MYIQDETGNCVEKERKPEEQYRTKGLLQYRNIKATIKCISDERMHCAIYLSLIWSKMHEAGIQTPS